MPRYLIEKDRTVVQSTSYCVKADSLEDAIKKVEEGKATSHGYSEYPVHEEDATSEFRYPDSHEITEEEWNEELGL